MAKTDFKSVTDYIAAQPLEARRALQRVRGVIQKAVPGAAEVISYQIPAYELPAGPVIYFAGWKEHYSLYPATNHVVSAFKEELAAYEVKKGTIRFPLSEPVPTRLIAGIATVRAREVAMRLEKKVKVRKSTSAETAVKAQTKASPKKATSKAPSRKKAKAKAKVKAPARRR